MGRTFVHAGIDVPEDFKALARPCLDVMAGKVPVGKLGETVRGHVLATDPARHFRQAVDISEEAVRLVSGMVWLVDGNAGPELGGGSPENRAASPAVMPEVRFERALSGVLSSRLANKPALVETNRVFPYSQMRWMKFLAKMEPSLPGITGTARSFFATLLFGIHHMGAVSRHPPHFERRVAWAESLARFLVRRMANARNAIILSSRASRMQKVKTGLLEKLRGKPQSVRKLTRRFHRVSTDECREALLELETEGKVARIGDLWGLPSSSSSPRSESSQHLLEV
jgi:hypothetical protein